MRVVSARSPVQDQLDVIAEKLQELGRLYYDLANDSMRSQSDPNMVYDAVRRGREFYARERQLRQFGKL